MARTRGERLRKATFNLPEEVLESLDRAVREGVAASKNVLVERALVRELEALRRATRSALWEEASRDPLFVQDIREVEASFGSADAEALGSVG
jgi:hypothetical protein